MRNSKQWVLIVLLCFLGVATQAQTLNDFRCALKKSYIIGNLDDWPQRIENMEKHSDGSFGWAFEVLEARYGLIGYYLGKGERDQAHEYLDDSQNILDSLLNRYPNSSKLNSVQAGFYGFHIALSMIKAPVLLPKMKRSLAKAFELNPNEPRAWLEKGNLAYNRPAAFGGDKQEAIKSYQKALELFQHEKNYSCNWMIIMVRALIVKAYYQTDQQGAYQTARNKLEEKYGKMNWINDFLKATIFD